MAQDTSTTPDGGAADETGPQHAASDDAAAEASPSAAAGVGVNTTPDDEDHTERVGAGDVDVVAVASVRADGTPDQTPGYEKIAGAARRGAQAVETR